jgi:hypothetical protein
MSKSAITKIEEPKGKEVWIACGTCSRETCHTVMTNVVQSDSWDQADIQTRDDYMTVQCQGCKTVSYFHRSLCSEDVRWNEETQQGEPVPTDKLYPSRIVGRAELEGIYELPHGLARVLQTNSRCDL